MLVVICNYCFCVVPWLQLYSVAALHQGAPGQLTWLEDPPPWLKTWLRPA